MTREQYDLYRPELIESLTELTRHGYKCYILNEQDKQYLYGFVITPSNNVLYVQRDSWAYRGWTFSLEYVPSKEHGSGCGCFEEPVQTIDLATIQRAEEEGLRFAKRLKATLYSSTEQWSKALWNKEEFVELKGE